MGTVRCRAAVAALLALPCAACSDGGGGGGGQERFSSYVKGLVDETAEDTQPEALDDLDVRFDEDPAAYDELFR
jgi:hypothetical protein